MRDMLAVGGVVKTHGVRGHVRVRSYSGESAHILGLKRVLIGKESARREYVVEEIRTAGRDMLVKLAGVDTPEDAAVLRGSDLWVGREDACPLDDEEYYVADLCDCLVYQSGRLLGKVRAVIESGAADLIEVVSEEGPGFFVPFVDEHVGEVDLEGKSIILTEGSEIP